MSRASPEAAKERLLRAIDVIDADLATLGLWACALIAFAQPAQSYEPDDLKADYIQAGPKLPHAQG